MRGTVETVVGSSHYHVMGTALATAGPSEVGVSFASAVPECDRFERRTGLLIDLDSLAVPCRDTEVTLEQVVAAAGACGHRYAAGVGPVVDGVEPVAARLGVRSLRVLANLQAADIASLTVAELLYDEGFNDLVICTHDSDFRVVPLPYTLVVTGGMPAGRWLIEWATRVIEIPRSSAFSRKAVGAGAAPR